MYKAKLVSESLNFKRGSNPKKSLGIGKYREIKNPTAEDWLAQPDGVFILQTADGLFAIVRWDREKKGFGMNVNGWYLGKTKEGTIKNSGIPPRTWFDEFPKFIHRSAFRGAEGIRHVNIISMQRIDPDELGKKI